MLSLSLTDNLIITVCQVSPGLLHSRNPVWGERTEADVRIVLVMASGVWRKAWSKQSWELSSKVTTLCTTLPRALNYKAHCYCKNGEDTVKNSAEQMAQHSGNESQNILPQSWTQIKKKKKLKRKIFRTMRKGINDIIFCCYGQIYLPISKSWERGNNFPCHAELQFPQLMKRNG